MWLATGCPALGIRTLRTGSTATSVVRWRTSTMRKIPSRYCQASFWASSIPRARSTSRTLARGKIAPVSCSPFFTLSGARMRRYLRDANTSEGWVTFQARTILLLCASWAMYRPSWMPNCPITTGLTMASQWAADLSQMQKETELVHQLLLSRTAARNVSL
jgi:hypothetical protein